MDGRDTPCLSSSPCEQGLDFLQDTIGEAQFGSHPEFYLPVPRPWHGLVRRRLCSAVPQVSLSFLCFRRLNDPSVVTPFSRDDRGHTPLHVAALCGMWSWMGLRGLTKDGLAEA